MGERKNDIPAMRASAELLLWKKFSTVFGVAVAVLVLTLIVLLRFYKITLNEKTANAYLNVSQDKRSVRHQETKQTLPDTPERFHPHPCVLGNEGYTFGRHYWEVEVELGLGGYWSLGIARESVRRHGGATQSPGHGIWAIERLWREGLYVALTFHDTTLHPKENPKVIGVYLNYDGGMLSLFNADSMEHLFTFKHRFTQKVFPYFWVGPNACLRLV
ncbi:E3 ubiquitin-protein ligase TRIM39-like isoform X2 [Ambystoma mexicanum]|uniref:E3 ubiquitin-protein ligase TRIM39-like isoform X2 n=1 Tax=Ambystoma mexicanum TaxID=8296 RepID=UPI0037E7EC59